MFCENCGKEMPDNAKFCPSCGHREGETAPEVVRHVVENKNMFLALLLSFFLSGIGIAYAGDKKKGIILFLVCILFNLIGISVPICAVIGIALWVYGLYETYNQVKIANGESNPNLIEDIKGFPTSKKVGAIIVIAVIFFIVVGGVIGAFAPKYDTTTTDYDLNDDYDSDMDTSSSQSSSGSGESYSSSSSSDGYDTHTHYEGEYGSSDTYGTVNDDGSVDAYQEGHTDYGDYEIDSHMDSEGNIHGTVDVGGNTYHVDSSNY